MPRQHVLSLSEIQLATALFYDSIVSFDAQLGLFTEILKTTGLRFNELFDFVRWSVVDQSTLMCITEKGSNNRLFDISALPSSFFDSIVGGVCPFMQVSYSTYTRYFRRFFPLSQMYVDSKKISSHIFRHCLIKTLYFDDELSLESIQALIGEVDVRNVAGYVNSVIWVYD